MATTETSEGSDEFYFQIAEEPTSEEVSKATNSRRLPADLKANLPLKTKSGRIFLLGDKLAEGGFGVVFKAIDSQTSNEFVAKLESTEGALRHENYIYRILCIRKHLEKFLEKHKVKEVGVLHPRGDGRIEAEGGTYDFIIFDQCDGDTHDLLVANRQDVSLKTLHKLARDVLLTLEFVHERGVIHNDIKPGNLLMKNGQSFLSDYGLATKLFRGDQHVQFLDEGKGFRGTIPFASRDAHSGNFSRKSDLEGFAITLLHLWRGSLPWDGLDEIETKAQKEKFFNNLESQELPDSLKNFFRMVNELDFYEKPNYEQARNLFTD